MPFKTPRQRRWFHANVAKGVVSRKKTHEERLKEETDRILNEAKRLGNLSALADYGIIDPKGIKQ